LFAPKVANFGFRAEKWRSGKLAQTEHDDNRRLEHRMAAIWKRGNYWRVEVHRMGYPIQNRTFDTKADAEAWGRQVEAKMDRGAFVDLKEAERNTLAQQVAIQFARANVASSAKADPRTGVKKPKRVWPLSLIANGTFDPDAVNRSVGPTICVAPATTLITLSSPGRPCGTPYRG
jgi:hypothetical protein